MLITENKYRAANVNFELSADFNIEQFLHDLTEGICAIAGGLEERTLHRFINEIMPDALAGIASRPAFRRLPLDEREKLVSDWDMILFILQTLRDLFTPLVLHNENQLKGVLEAVIKPETLLERK